MTIQPWHTPFPCWTSLLSMSGFNSCVLTCIHVSQNTGKVVWYSHLGWFSIVCCDPHKSFSVVDEAEVDIFLEFSSFLHDPTNVGNLISGSCAFSKSSLYIWKFSVHILLKPSLKNFEHNLASMWNEQNSVVVWTSFGIVLFWDWNKNWPFSVLWPLLSFPNFTHC